ncbi:MAG: hypothetical protein JWM11_7670, partial [Planctomycetaceae bacterium]|nr:hypothetical protein [Planctomycetaceae bacterium]
DLSRLLGSLLEDDQTRWQLALDHYQTFRPLSLQDWKLIRGYDQSSVLLSGITWLEWLILERRTFPDDHLVEQRLQIIERRLKHLAATL